MLSSLSGLASGQGRAAYGQGGAHSQGLFDRAWSSASRQQAFDFGGSVVERFLRLGRLLDHT